MANICVGCGLTTNDENRLVVNTSGETWAAAPSTIPDGAARTGAAHTHGGEVFCAEEPDGDGKLYVAPEHTSRVWSTSRAGRGLVEWTGGVTEDDGTGGTGNIPAGSRRSIGGGDAASRSQVLSITNPSTARSMILDVRVVATARAQLNRTRFNDDRGLEVSTFVLLDVNNQEEDSWTVIKSWTYEQRNAEDNVAANLTVVGHDDERFSPFYTIGPGETITFRGHLQYTVQGPSADRNTLEAINYRTPDITVFGTTI